MTILGIETSCDETALALLETRGSGNSFDCRVIQSLVHSQAELHRAYGGVYPSLAKREHGKNLVPLLAKVLKDFPIRNVISDTEFKARLNSFKQELELQNPDLYESVLHADFLRNVPQIDNIAVTEGPGLEPALWVGINFARILGALWKIPVIPVNHMEGHVVGSLLQSDEPGGSWQKLKKLETPSLALLISGGHTELVQVGSEHGHDSSSNNLQYSIIGQTKDDAVGEAFDKVARLLGLPYPGGPHLSKLAHEAWQEKITSPVKLPRPMISSGDLNFSFSGLKTAVLYAIRKATEAGQFDEKFKKGLAYEFEQSVADTLEAKLRNALDATQAKSVIIGGGVSANHVLRQRFERVAKEYDVPVFMPSKHISGDNALMIALAGALHDANGAHGRNSEGQNAAKGTIKRPLRAHGTKKLGTLAS